MYIEHLMEQVTCSNQDKLEGRESASAPYAMRPYHTDIITVNNVAFIVIDVDVKK